MPYYIETNCGTGTDLSEVENLDKERPEIRCPGMDISGPCEDRHYIDPEKVPRFFRLPRNKKLSKIFQFGGYGLGVPEIFRAKVEDLEPGVHQFFPIDVELRTGEHLAPQYYLLNCRTYLEALDTEKTTAKFYSRATENYIDETSYGGQYFRPVAYLMSEQKKIENPKDLFFFKEEMVRGRAIWREGGMLGLSSWWWIFSDDLWAFCRKNKLSGLAACRTFLS